MIFVEELTQIYLFGGKVYDDENKVHFSNEVWIFHILENKWEEITTKGVQDIKREIRSWNGITEEITVS